MTWSALILALALAPQAEVCRGSLVPVVAAAGSVAATELALVGTVLAAPTINQQVGAHGPLVSLMVFSVAAGFGVGSVAILPWVVGEACGDDGSGWQDGLGSVFGAAGGAVGGAMAGAAVGGTVGFAIATANDFRSGEGWVLIGAVVLGVGGAMLIAPVGAGVGAAVAHIQHEREDRWNVE